MHAHKSRSRSGGGGGGGRRSEPLYTYEGAYTCMHTSPALVVGGGGGGGRSERGEGNGSRTCTTKLEFWGNYANPRI